MMIMSIVFVRLKLSKLARVKRIITCRVFVCLELSEFETRPKLLFNIIFNFILKRV